LGNAFCKLNTEFSQDPQYILSHYITQISCSNWLLLISFDILDTAFQYPAIYDALSRLY